MTDRTALLQLAALDHGAHGTVEDEDGLFEALLQEVGSISHNHLLCPRSVREGT
jgi:hypothetical protein